MKNLTEEQRLAWYEQLSEQYSIIPVNGKAPIEAEWTKWCEKKRPFNTEDFAGRNAGIATGPASDLIVLDIDDWNLFESFRQRYGYPALPKTMIVKSGGSTPERPKYHYYLRYPDDGQQYGRKAFKTLGFDLVGVGGQVVAPLSIHPVTGNPYEIQSDSNIADPPDWILDLFTTEKREWKKIDVDKLRISDEVKTVIDKGKPQGERSEAMMSVINALVSAGCSDDQIFYVFYTYPIGEKHLERGSTRDRQLQIEIDKAREYVAKTPVQNDDFELKIIWGNELIERQYQIMPLIHGLLEEKGSLLVIGPTGIGKSIFTLNVAMAVGSAQESLWNRFAIQRPLRTAIVQAENPVEFVWQRMVMMANGEDSLRAGLDYVAFPEIDNRFRTMGFRFKEQRFRNLIYRIKDQTKAEILIIDPLISYAGVDENNNSETRNSLDVLTDVCMQTEMSAIVIHHSGKIGDQGVFTGRGASSIADWASNIVVLKREKISGSETIQVKKEKTRVGPGTDKFYLEKGDDLILRVKNPFDDFDYSQVISLFRDNNRSFDSKAELTKEIQSKIKVGEHKAREVINESVIRKIINVESGERNKKIYKLNSVY
jgi:RecA-family ATPase